MGRFHLWELHRWAVDYGQDPAVLLGIDPIAESWFAYQVRSAVHRWGTWFQAQREATRMVPVPKSKREPMMPVPKYSNEQLAQMLGVDGPSTTPEQQQEIDDLAEQLLNGTVDWSQWEEPTSTAESASTAS